MLKQKMAWTLETVYIRASPALKQVAVKIPNAWTRGDLLVPSPFAESSHTAKLSSIQSRRSGAMSKE